MPTLTQLEYVAAVDKLRHFGRAAERCHVTQPTLSTQIQKVEDEIGYPLFDRLKKPVVPTDKGTRFIAQARVLLREHRRLMDLSRTERTEVAGELRVGVIPTVSPYLLPLFLTTFAASYPKLHLIVDELKTDDILERLNDDALDAGILATPLHQPGLTERPLYFEPFSLYVSRDHELNARKRLRARDLRSGDTWLLGEGHCLRHQVESFCTRGHDAGVIPNVHFEGGTIDTLRNLVRRSRGYTLVPALFVETLGAVERRDFVREFEAPQPTRQISLVFRRDQWKADLLKALTEVVRLGVPAALRERDDQRWDILEPRPRERK